MKFHGFFSQEMHVRYSTQKSEPQGNQVQLLYVLAHPFLVASFAPDNNN